MLRENAAYPVTLSREEADRINEFIKKGYTRDVGGITLVRQEMWRHALDVQQKIAEETMNGINSVQSMTLVLFETQITDLDILAQASFDFGFNPDEQLVVAEALFTVRDSFEINRQKFLDAKSDLTD